MPVVVVDEVVVVAPLAWEEDKRWLGSCEGSIDCLPSSLRMILDLGLAAEVDIRYYM